MLYSDYQEISCLIYIYSNWKALKYDVTAQLLSKENTSLNLV